MKVTIGTSSITATEKGSPDSQRLSYRYVTQHPVAFREYFVPKITARGYWHRFTFSPVMLSAEQGDTLCKAGRGTGKSFSLLEPEIVRHALNHPGEETIITAMRKTHVADRVERVIDYFEQTPQLKVWLRRVNRAPIYMIVLWNGHTIYGFSVGDDPEAKMAQGKHASLIVIEEAHQYPDRAWKKIQGAVDPRGYRMMLVGVPDGRMGTPFREADSRIGSFRGRRFQIGGRTDPYWNAAAKQKKVDTLGSEVSDVFRQEVDAEWGSPTWSAWDLEAIQRNLDPDLRREFYEISGRSSKEYGLTAQAMLPSLTGRDARSETVYVAMDVGYSSASEIGVFEYWSGRWHLSCRVRIVDRMESPEQRKVLEWISRQYGADFIGVDTTDGDGRSMCAELEVEWGDRIKRCAFNENYITEYTLNKDTDEYEKVEENGKLLSTRLLRNAFKDISFALPSTGQGGVDEDIVSEFNQEVETRTPDGAVRVKTPDTVHITDMFRVFALALFMNDPVIEPMATIPFAAPEVGAGAGVWGRDTGW